REAERFCAQVLACLDSGKRVLGVLQACDAPLVRAVRAREDVSVIEVTPENREKLLEALCRAL
ncbi:MAG: nucleoside-triphosphatase, partial [Clostridiales bacterium]|nr:nucleoside-triphosphatase [Clostridiales bacterium]